jgi:hypothetical protein
MCAISVICAYLRLVLAQIQMHLGHKKCRSDRSSARLHRDVREWLQHCRPPPTQQRRINRPYTWVLWVSRPPKSHTSTFDEQRDARRGSKPATLGDLNTHVTLNSLVGDTKHQHGLRRMLCMLVVSLFLFLQMRRHHLLHVVLILRIYCSHGG